MRLTLAARFCYFTTMVGRPLAHISEFPDAPCLQYSDWFREVGPAGECVDTLPADPEEVLYLGATR